jgi:hypothetical protein
MTRPARKKPGTKGVEIESSNGYGIQGNKAGSSAFARTTVVFPPALNANWEAFALQSGRAKNEVLIEALTRYLKQAGLQPDKFPTLKVSY